MAVTVRPLARWTRRIAVETLLRCCPPGPLERCMWTSHSRSRRASSKSSLRRRSRRVESSRSDGLCGDLVLMALNPGRRLRFSLKRVSRDSTISW